MNPRQSYYFRAAISGLTLLLAGLAGQAAAQDTGQTPANTSGNAGLLELPSAQPVAPAPLPQTPAAVPPVLPAAPVAMPAVPPVSAPPGTSPPLAITAPMTPATPVSSPPMLAPTSSPATPAAVAPPTPPAMPVTAHPVAASHPVPGGPIGPAGSSQQSLADMLAKNPDVLFAPAHLGPEVSLMFKKNDLNVINEALAVYDKSSRAQNQGEGSKDDLSSLINSLKVKGDESTPNVAPPPLPNLYLGSIVYYSPGNWSVWINSRKLTNRTNQRDHELYVTRLSREEIEVVWKPINLLDTPAVWDRLTDNGAHPLPRVTVDERNGTITLVLRTNQTFLPRTLDIREGLVKSISVGAPPATASEDTSAATQISPNVQAPGIIARHP